MKRSISVLIMFLMLGFSGNAQTSGTGGKNNYIVSTTKIPQLQPIILTAESLKKEDGEQFGDFQVVIYGPNNDGLTNKEEMEAYITRAKAAGVQILVCKLSIEKFNVDPNDLHEDVKMVDHAFTHLIQLQKNKNYYSIQL